MRTILALGTVCLLLSVVACGSDGGGGAGGSSFAPLVPESTGWVRVASVASPVPLEAEHDPFAVTAYDLQVDGATLRALYSVDTLIPAVQQTTTPFQSRFFKAKTALGASDAPVITATEIADIVTNQQTLEEVRRPTFRPGSDTLETLLFTRSTLSGARSHVQLFDEAQRTITQLEFQFNGIHVTKTLPNGDLLAGDVNASAIGELEHYRRATNTWTSINQSAGDGQVLIAYTPFELDDGIDLAFRLYAKDDKAFLSIADFAPAAQFPAAPYTARFTEEHAEYARTGVGANGVAPVFAAATNVACYLTTGKSLTTVLASKDNASSAYTLSAYAWPAGATVFTTLYSGVSISKGLGDLMTGGREKVQCHADGTVYAIVSESGGSRLALAGAAGERSLGVVAPSTDHTAVLGQLRFVDGAYYAAVGLLLVNATYQGPELEIVKLVP